MLNNVYVDKTTGENVRIIKEDTNSNFFILDNNVSIKKDIFSKKYELKEEIDPNSFFNPTYNSADPLINLANQLKNLDTNKISDVPNAGTSVKYTPPVVLSDTSMPNGVVKQPQVEEPLILTPEQKRAMLEDWRNTQPGAQIESVQDKNWDDDNRFLNGDKPIIIKDVVKKEETKIDPMTMMFKMFKNNYPVKLNIVLEENIPNPTFIGMVQENVETDAIEYYSNLISEKILNDTSKLKEEIYNQLKSIINKELGVK